MNEIILAPYIGDEVIGCYDYLNRGLIKHVFYFYDLRRKRRREAAACGKFFGFVVDFVEDHTDFFNNFYYHIPHSATILVPNVNNRHPNHKHINALAKMNHVGTIFYYGVDMLTGSTLANAPNKKRRVLNKLFPSQKKCFSKHDEYHLYETILAADFSCSYSFKETINEVTTKTTISWKLGIRIELLEREIEGIIRDVMIQNIDQPLSVLGESIIKRFIGYFGVYHQISVELMRGASNPITIRYGA